MQRLGRILMVEDHPEDLQLTLITPSGELKK
jgi:hypothetical protein